MTADRRVEPSAGVLVGAFTDVFAGLERAPALLLAVSGGPDSMALLHLAAQWMASPGRRPRLHVATVDHGLRPESAAEAALVATAAADLGLPHTTLVWTARKPTTRIQERARAARYGLLAGRAQAIGATGVVTAHHADDQAETVLMRLGRGSGPGGLAGMRRETVLAPGICLMRPLLAVPKADLVAFCRRLGCTVCEDPSNADLAYARPRLRAQADAAAALGLNTANLCRLADRMARVEDALDQAAWQLQRNLMPTVRAGFWGADLTRARDRSPVLVQPVLRRALVSVVGDRDIRLDRLEALTDELQRALRDARTYRATLAGARIVLSALGVVTIEPEPPRRRGMARASDVLQVIPMQGVLT